MYKYYIRGLLLSGISLSLAIIPVFSDSVSLSPPSVHAQNVQEDRIIYWTQSSEITTLDSVKSYDTVAYTALSKVGEGLLKIATNGSIVPAGAELPQVSEDGLTYTFKLNKNAKWSNGDPVTAQDYVYAWQRAVNPETGAANAYQFNIIQNAKEIADGKKDISELGVEAVNDYELKVTLYEPKANFLNYISHVNYFPQSKKAVETAGESYGTSAETFLGNGPFTIENWRATSLEWTFTKNPFYYGSDKIQVDQVHVDVVKDANTAVELWEAGEIDVATINGPLLAEYLGSERLFHFPGQSHSYIEFGISSSQPLQNENVRKAFSLVIDRDTLTKNILSGGAQKVKGLIPQNVVFNRVTNEDFVTLQEDYAIFDIALAQKLWSKAKEELQVESIVLELLVTDSDYAKSIGEYIQGQVETNLSGFKIILQPLPAKNRFERMMSFDFDIALGGWSASLGDSDEFLLNFTSKAEHNHAQFFDKNFDALIQSANAPNAVKDQAYRNELLYEAERYLLDRQIFVPLIQTNTSLLVSEKIKKIEVNPNGSGVDFTTLTFQ